jgi:Mn2+/Fe2+ NRAMP family transporter
MTPEEQAARVNAVVGSLPESDRLLASTLVRRDAYDLALSLKPFTGNIIAQYVFGIGVVGMTLTSGLLLMLINGFVLSEMFGKPTRGWVYRIGTLMPCIGLLGPFVIGTQEAQVWLMIPTSVFALVVLPIAYVTFYLLMNQKSLLGKDMPRGARRVVWNFLMAVAAGVAAFASFWSLWNKVRWLGVAAVVAFIALAVIVHFIRAGKVKALSQE